MRDHPHICFRQHCLPAYLTASDGTSFNNGCGTKQPTWSLALHAYFNYVTLKLQNIREQQSYKAGFVHGVGRV